MSTQRNGDFRHTTLNTSDVAEGNSQPTLIRPNQQSFSIDDIMWRVRSEVARRRNGHNGNATPALPVQVPSFEQSVPSWKPAAARLPTKERYVLAELLDRKSVV